MPEFSDETQPRRPTLPVKPTGLAEKIRAHDLRVEQAKIAQLNELKQTVRFGINPDYPDLAPGNVDPFNEELGPLDYLESEKEREQFLPPGFKVAKPYSYQVKQVFSGEFPAVADDSLAKQATVQAATSEVAETKVNKPTSPWRAFRRFIPLGQKPPDILQTSEFPSVLLEAVSAFEVATADTQAQSAEDSRLEDTKQHVPVETQLNMKAFDESLGLFTQKWEALLKKIDEVGAAKILYALQGLAVKNRQNYAELKKIYEQEIKAQPDSQSKQLDAETNNRIHQLLFTLVKLTYFNLVLYELIQHPTENPFLKLQKLGRTLTFQTLSSIQSIKEAIARDALLDYLFDVWNHNIGHSQPVVEPGKPKTREQIIPGDKDLGTEAGGFPVEVKGARTELTAFIFAQLRSMAVTRWGGPDSGLPSNFKDGKTHTALPERSHYFVVVQVGEHIGKIAIPAALLALNQKDPQKIQNAFDSFHTAFLQEMAVMQQQGKLLKTQPLSPSELEAKRKQAYGKGMPYQKKENILKEELKTGNYANLDVADLKVIVKKKGTYKGRRLTSAGLIQTDPQCYIYGTDVVRVMTVDEKGNFTDEAGYKYKHSETDGRLGAAEPFWVKKAVKRLFSRFGKNVETEFESHTIRTLHSLFPNWKNPEIQDDGECLVSFAELDRTKYQQRINTLFEKYKDVFPISFPMILAEAVCITLGVDSAHFLEAVPEQYGLAPSILQTSKHLREKIQQNKKFTKREEQLWLLEQGSWSSVFRKDTQLGLGLTAVTGSLAGNDLKDFLSFTGNIANRSTTQKLVNTVLLSFMVGAQPLRENPEDEGMSVEEFNTARGALYPQLGVGAVESKGTVHVSLRDTAFSKSRAHQFEHELVTNFEKVLKRWEEVISNQPKVIRKAT